MDANNAGEEILCKGFIWNEVNSVCLLDLFWCSGEKQTMYRKVLQEKSSPPNFSNTLAYDKNTGLAAC